MAAFNQAKDAPGNDVVRCLSRERLRRCWPGRRPRWRAGRASLGMRSSGSAPSRASSAWNKKTCGCWPAPSAIWMRLASIPDGNLLAYVQHMEMTSLVGMVDPPREESKAEVAYAQAGHIRVCGW
jgi:Ca2+-transporting ATPase